ncbi:hypothetical protein ACIBEF_32140 [Micromonospora sp. NPDC050795]|uniref:hypothetical protein n=1 Tax=Micromonospora sp. NPDC050795 TaxID=3364282 RepID=UPI0037BC833B
MLTYAVRFYDGHALWERQRSDLRQLSATLAEQDLTIVATTQSIQPVTDCGTNGGPCAEGAAERLPDRLRGPAHPRPTTNNLNSQDQPLN